jgi:uncharacterized small protein (DUF1192 family)
VLDPPGVSDFEGNWSRWAQKQRELQAAAKPQKKPASKPQPEPPAKATAKSEPQPQARTQAKPKKDNVYARKFGKLSTGELESRIASTESAIAALQADLADPGVYRDADRAKQVQTKLAAATDDLSQLEAEYFAREQE